MQESTSTLNAAIDAESQYPLFKVLLERGSSPMLWNVIDETSHDLRLHAVHQQDSSVLILSYETVGGSWNITRFDSPYEVHGGGFSLNNGTSVSFSDDANYVETLTTFHRVYVDQNGTRNILFMKNGAVYLLTENGSVTSAGSLTGMGWTDSAGVSVATRSYSSNSAPSIYVNNTTSGRIDRTLIGGSGTAAWDYGDGWLIYHLAPYAVRDDVGREHIYFTAASKTGQGKSLWHTFYDTTANVWKQPEQLFVFDTTNPNNGMSYPMVSVLEEGWYALSYIKQTADSDSTVSSKYIAVRLSDRIGRRWGPEHIVAPLTELGGITYRDEIGPDQFSPVVFDRAGRTLLVFQQQGYFSRIVDTTWGLPPSGVDITNQLFGMDVSAVSGTTASQWNSVFIPSAPTTEINESDLFHVQIGYTTTEGEEFLPVFSGRVDESDMDMEQQVINLHGREITADMIDRGQQDEAVQWYGANQYAFRPVADAYQAFVLPTAIDRETATNTSYVLEDAYVAATATADAVVQLSVALNPVDECDAIDLKRFLYHAPVKAQVDQTCEALFEIKPQGKIVVDPMPGVFLGADTDGSVYYACVYSVLTRTFKFIVQRQSLLGDSVEEATIATVPPGSGGIFTRVGIRLHKHGRKIAVSYMLQNGKAGSQLWYDNAYVYTDTAVASSYTKTPQSLDTEGYSGVCGFTPVTITGNNSTTSMYVASFTSYGAFPPLTQQQVIRDAYLLGGFKSTVLGYGYEYGDEAETGQAILTALPSNGVWEVDPSDPTQLRHSGSLATFGSMDTQTDSMLRVRTVGQTEYITLEARIDKTGIHQATSPVPQQYSGTSYGITLTSKTGTAATEIAISTGIYIWIWYRQADNTVVTIRTFPVPSWFSAMYATDYLPEGQYTLAVQDSYLAAWYNDLYLGGFDLDSLISPPFTAVRSGYTLASLSQVPTSGYSYVRELQLPVINQTIAELILPMGDKLNTWLDGVIGNTAVDVAPRPDGTIRIIRSDLARTADRTITDDMLTATVQNSGYEWVSHVRYVGKDGIYGDAYDFSRSVQKKSRFLVVEDDTLKTVQECREAAKRKLIAVNRKEIQVNGSFVYDPRLERLDVIRWYRTDYPPIDKTVIMVDFNLRLENGSFLTLQPGTQEIGTNDGE